MPVVGTSSGGDNCATHPETPLRHIPLREETPKGVRAWPVTRMQQTFSSTPAEITDDILLRVADDAFYRVAILAPSGLLHIRQTNLFRAIIVSGLRSIDHPPFLRQIAPGFNSHRSWMSLKTIYCNFGTPVRSPSSSFLGFITTTNWCSMILEYLDREDTRRA